MPSEGDCQDMQVEFLTVAGVLAWNGGDLPQRVAMFDRAA
jgi:hypothetical protein